MPALIPGSIIVIVILVTSFWYIYPNYVEFPMDDTYIHFVYAQNLAGEGKLYFNTSEEIGVGTTSFLWVALLAAGDKIGIPLHTLAKSLGLASLAAVSLACFSLVRSFLGPRPSFALALLIGLSGNLLWFALSGMETMAFLAIGVLALLVYRRERWVLLGVLIGLLTLTRPEGIALGFAIAFIELVRHKRITPEIVLCGVVSIITCLPWFAYLRLRTGNFLPTSAIGKHFSHQVALQYVFENNPTLALLGKVPALTYVTVWIFYLLEFSLGGMSLPPPHLPVGKIFRNNEYTISLWALAGWVGSSVLIYKARAHTRVFRRWSPWIKREAQRPVVVLFVWTALHNLVYMALFPYPGTASRYGALNYLVLWMAVVICLQRISASVWNKFWMAGAIAILVGANTLYWNKVYDSNLDHMKNVRIKAAHFIRGGSAPDDKCAATDIGAVRFHSRRAIIDLGGLIEPNAREWYLKGMIAEQLLDEGATCLILPGRSGSQDEGWLDLAEILGLSTSSSLDLNPVAVFEIDRDRWLQGYLPTNNYQASVVIYQVSPRAQSKSLNPREIVLPAEHGG